MHLTEMNVEQLVSMVSKDKELYDKCNGDYKNVDKLLSWKGIADQIGLVGEFHFP